MPAAELQTFCNQSQKLHNALAALYMGRDYDLCCSIIVYSFSNTDKWEGEINAISAQVQKHIIEVC